VLLGANLPHNYTSQIHSKENNYEAIVLQFPSAIFNSFLECEMLHSLYKEADKGIKFINPHKKHFNYCMTLKHYRKQNNWRVYFK